MVARRVAAHAVIASSVTHSVRLLRRRSPPSYSAQFTAARYIFGMWRQPLAFFLGGIEAAVLDVDDGQSAYRPGAPPCTSATVRSASGGLYHAPFSRAS